MTVEISLTQTTNSWAYTYIKKVCLLFSLKQDSELIILTCNLLKLLKLLNYIGWNKICIVPKTIMHDLKKKLNQRMKEINPLKAP